jgi:hypothetical protein
MTLDELLAALEWLDEGDWQILDVLSAGGSGRPEVGAAPPEGHPSRTTTPRRPGRRLRNTADKPVVKTGLRIN